MYVCVYSRGHRNSGLSISWVTW